MRAFEGSWKKNLFCVLVGELYRCDSPILRNVYLRTLGWILGRHFWLSVSRGTLIMTSGSGEFKILDLRRIMGWAHLEEQR